MKRELTKEEKQEILSLKRSDITSKKLKDLFAVRPGQDAPRFEPNYTFTLLANEAPFTNKETVKTTIGRYIVNLLVVPESYHKAKGYLNTVLDANAIEDFEGALGDLLLNDKITVQDYIDYLNNGEWLGMNTAFYMLPSMNYEINRPIPEVIKRRDELFDKYKDQIAAGDSNVANTIETELLKMAEKDLVSSGNPSYDFFASKEFKFKNNYKKSSIMGGAFMYPATGKIAISKSNYMDGITPQDYPLFSSLTVAGGYARGVTTQDGGYATKKLNAAMQAAVIDVKGTDCKTKITIPILLTKASSKLYIDRYIMENGQPVLLTKSNIGSYIGKTIKLRSPMVCKNPKCCNICAGELFYKLDMPNAGLLTSTFSGTLMNKSMKTMHDASIKFTKINFDDYIEER